MNEKERSVKRAWDSTSGDTLDFWSAFVRALEVGHWVHQPPVPPSPHWRDLPAGPALDRIVRDTFFPGEALVLNKDPWHAGEWIVQPRSTDLALAMEMLKPGEHVGPHPEGRGLSKVCFLHSDGRGTTTIGCTLAQVPEQICRAKLAAHEAGR